MNLLAPATLKLRHISDRFGLRRRYEHLKYRVLSVSKVTDDVLPAPKDIDVLQGADTMITSDRRSLARELNSERTQLRCFVGYFGVNRSLRWTADSIKANILLPLDNAGVHLTQAAHFNCPTFFDSPRSGEHHVPAETNPPNLAGLELCWLEPQDFTKLGQLYDQLMLFPWRGERDEEGITRRNALLQLYSLRQLAKLLKSLDPDRFDIFCLLRADLLYLDPVPVAALASSILGGMDLITPSWSRCGGLNDRFAFCSRQGADAYLNRIEDAPAMCAEKGYFHSETLLSYAVKKKNLKTAFTVLRANRVRATGQIKNENFEC